MKRLILEIALRVALLYAFFAGLWILLSDRILFAVVKNPELLTQMQTYKGWTFVITTSILLFYALRRAENKLRSREARYRLLAENFPDGIVSLYDLNLRFIVCDGAGLASMGLSKQLVEGKTIRDVFPKETCDIIERNFHAALAGNAAVAEIPFRNRTYGVRHIPVKNEKGEIVAVMAVSQDITHERQIETELVKSKIKYQSLFDNANDSIYLINQETWEIIDCNKRAALLDGYTTEELKKMKIMDLQTPEEISALKEIFKDLDIKGPVSGLSGFNHKRKDGSFVPVEINSATVEIGGEKYRLSIVRDITERKRVEDTLRESEAKFRILTETTSSAIFIIQGDKFRYANAGAEVITGYTKEELCQMYFWEGVHPDFREMVKERGFARQQGDSLPPQYEFKIIRKDGGERWVDFTVAAFVNEGNPALIATGVDVTERKRDEELLKRSNEQLRSLTARLDAIKEEESSRIAREIHDELGQTLTGLKMDISFMEEAFAEGKVPDLKYKLDSMSHLTDSAIRSVRRISTELRPVVLDSLGIVAAIEWQADEFRTRTGIVCECSLPPEEEELPISRGISTTVFRILQESLTNVARHAKASRVRITLTQGEGMLLLEIKDDGLGISPADLHKRGSFGLIGMRERAALHGGRIEINGIGGTGTTVRLSIPLAAEKINENYSSIIMGDL